MRFMIFSVLAFLLCACASSEISGAPSQTGVEAYRAKNYQEAWAQLSPLAESGYYRAQRYLAFMLLEGNAPVDCAPAECETEAVELLLDGARRGDNNALIVLEAMRASEASYAPSDADLLAIEQTRAGQGDPMTAWRLAKRYRDGAGVAQSSEEMVRWLKVAASGKQDTHSFTADAAFQLCQAYASGEGVREDQKKAWRWCKRAADNGHNGAVIALAQMWRARR